MTQQPSTAYQNRFMSNTMSELQQPSPANQKRFMSNTMSQLREENYNPVSKCQLVPLLSLEESLENVKSLLPDVMNDVYVAKRECKQNTNLTIDESRAIYIYTKTKLIYKNLNEALRNQNSDVAEKWYPFLKLLMNAFMKLPACPNTVWRGLCSVQGTDFGEASVHTLWSVTSCSTNVAVASCFANKSGVLLCIETKYGRNISDYSAYPDESEVVLMPGTQLRVKSIQSESNGVSIVHLEECCLIPSGKHVKLSYHKSDQNLATKIGLNLRTMNIPVWFYEQEDMYTFRDSLALGVENAAIVCCLIARDYQACIKCKLELQYSQKRSKKIISCILTDPNVWKPSEWLELIINHSRCIEFDVCTNTIDIDYITNGLIFHIQKLSLSSEHVLSTTNDEPSYLYEWVRYEYLQHSRIERFINPAKTFPIEQSYINLAIVSAKDYQRKENQMCDVSHASAVLDTYENIYGETTPVDLKNIFEACKTSEKQVLVFGRAGIGKSTFCRYNAYQWATGAYWSQYELLVVIPLRNLTADEYPPLQNKQVYSLFDIVKSEVFKNELSDHDERLLEKQFDAKKTLWILDGYDEIVQNIAPHLKHLLKKLLETSHHILTSRPYLNKLSYKVQMEITGFTDANIEQYVGQFFRHLDDELDDASTKAESLLQLLTINSSVFGIAHIPVNLELICSIWSNTDFSSTLNLTVTALYTKIIEWLCRRYVQSQNVNIDILSDEDINRECHIQLTFFQRLAFQAMEDNTIVIRAPVLNKALNEANISVEHNTHILNFGVLKSFDKHGISTRTMPDKDHYFIHLSFQEYFAAQYLVNQLRGSSNTNVIEFIKYQKYNQRYALLFSFMAGLSSGNSVDSTCHLFWNTILGEPRDLVGVRHIQLLVSCIEATFDNQHTPHRREVLEQITKVIEYFTCEENYITWNDLLQPSGKTQSITCRERIVTKLTNFLQSDKPEEKKSGLSFITKCIISNLTAALYTPILNSMESKNAKVRMSACEALGNIGKKAATKEVMDKLVSALSAKDPLFTICAHRTLSNMVEGGGTNHLNETISKLILNRNTELSINKSNILTETFTSSSFVLLYPQFLSYHYFREEDHILENFSAELLFNIWLESENYHWLLILGRLLLLRAVAIVINHDKLILYENREPVEISVPKENLRQDLNKVLANIRNKLCLSLENQSEVEYKSVHKVVSDHVAIFIFLLSLVASITFIASCLLFDWQVNCVYFVLSKILN